MSGASVAKPDGAAMEKLTAQLAGANKRAEVRQQRGWPCCLPAVCTLCCPHHLQAAEAALAQAQAEISQLVQSSRDGAIAMEERMQQMQSELQAAKVCSVGEQPACSMAVL